MDWPLAITSLTASSLNSFVYFPFGIFCIGHLVYVFLVHYFGIHIFQPTSDADDMRAKAAKVEADAVIVSYHGEYVSTREQWAKQQQHKDSYSRITATAIKYPKENQ